MKKIKALFAVALSVIIASCTFYGCNMGISEDPNAEQIDTDRTQLRIAAPDDGWGMEGYYALKDLFEEEYKDVSFEEGKKGVQIIVDGDKMSYAGSTLINLLDSTENEVFFSDMIAYHSYYDKFLDITDIVTESLSDVGEEGTIKDKMSDSQIEFYDIDGKIYALPHNFVYESLIYNVDLFDKNLLYFADNQNNGNEGFIRTPNDKKGPGPDGDYSTTFDNGLPRTYDEFFRLCARMKKMNISPWTMVAGRYAGYVSWMLAALWADYEGAEQVSLRYDMNGTAKNIIEKINDDGSFTVKGNGNGYAINENNAYELYQQAGSYYALQFLYEIISKGYYAENTFNQSATHTSIQADFIYTGIVPGVEKIGILGEGAWWYAESKDTFATLSATYQNADRNSRRFSVMPLPKATEAQVGQKSTIVSSSDSVAFIKKNLKPEKVALAKLFFKWCHTDRALQAYTLSCNNIKDFDYDFTDEQYASLPLWTQSSYIYKSKSDIVYAVSTNEIYKAHPADFYIEDMWWTKIDSDTYRYPSQAIKDYGIKAKDYFLGMKNYYTSSFWSRYL